MHRIIALVAIITLLLLPSHTKAQVGAAGQGSPPAPGLEAPTRLEALELRKNTVIVKGYT